QGRSRRGRASRAPSGDSFISPPPYLRALRARLSFRPELRPTETSSLACKSGIRLANAVGWASRVITRRSGIPEVPAGAARALREAERRLGASARAAAASAARDRAQISTPPAARPPPQRRASSGSRMPASVRAGGEPSAAPVRRLAPASPPPPPGQRPRGAP